MVKTKILATKLISRTGHLFEPARLRNPTVLRQCRIYVLVENLNMGKAKQVKKKKKQK